MAVTRRALRKQRSLPTSFSVLFVFFVKLFETDAPNKVFRDVDQWFPNPSWLNTPSNKPSKADLGLYITAEGRWLVRSGVGRWRLQFYTIKSHCAALFLAL